MRRYNVSCSRRTSSITSKFEIGDVVKVTDLGQVYSTYQSAMAYFGIPKKYIKREDGYYPGYRLNYDFIHKNEEECKQDNWVILDIALHGSFDSTLVYYIKNIKRDIVLIIGDEGMKLNKNIPNKITEKLRKSNDTKLIDKINHNLKYV